MSTTAILDTRHNSTVVVESSRTGQGIRGLVTGIMEIIMDGRGLRWRGRGRRRVGARKGVRRVWDQVGMVAEDGCWEVSDRGWCGELH